MSYYDYFHNYIIIIVIIVIVIIIIIIVRKDIDIFIVAKESRIIYVIRFVKC